jgi:hypothetical protein
LQNPKTVKIKTQTALRSLLSGMSKQFVVLSSDVAHYRILNWKMLHVILINTN